MSLINYLDKNVFVKKYTISNKCLEIEISDTFWKYCVGNTLYKIYFKNLPKYYYKSIEYYINNSTWKCITVRITGKSILDAYLASGYKIPYDLDEETIYCYKKRI